MQHSVPMELVESVLEQIEDGVVIALPDGRITYHNRMILDMFGLPKGKVPAALSDLGEINWNKRIIRAALDAGNQYGMATSSDRPMRFEEKVTAGATVRFLEFTIRRLVFRHAQE